MKKTGVALLAIVLPLLAGCGGSKVTVGNDNQFVQATPFKTLPEEADGSIITGIGNSEKRSNFTLMREAAITSAQADLARKVQSKVEAVWKRTMADWSEYKKTDFTEAQSLEEMKNMQKVIVDTELRGPWQTQEMVDKASGRYWVRIMYSASTVEKYLKQRMESEGVLKKYFIETQLKTVRDDLQKDLDSARQREKADFARIAEISK